MLQQGRSHIDSCEGFFSSLLGESSIELYAGSARHETVLEGVSTWHEVALTGAFAIKPAEYVKVLPRDQVLLPEGVCGRFCAPSTLIDKGLLLTAGKLDPGYGRGGHRVIFGLYNARRVPVEIDLQTRVAHVSFYDLRGVASEAARRMLAAELEAVLHRRK